MKKLLIYLCAGLLTGCIFEKTPAETGSIRDPNREISVGEREGLAFSRLLTSPVVFPILFYRGYDYFKPDDRPMEIFKTDPVSLTLSSLLLAAFKTPFIMSEEIVVSLPEILSTAQFKSAYYPWETYVGNKRDRTYEEDINDPELKRIAAESNARMIERAADVAEVAIEVGGEALSQAIDQEIQRQFGGKRVVGGAGAGMDAGVDASGFGTIKGSGYLNEGSTSTYSLYVRGQKITSGVSWSGGTCLTVSNNGSYARAMAGNPPIKSGTYRTTIRATYGGRTFSKTIMIRKTGKSAFVNKYK